MPLEDLDIYTLFAYRYLVDDSKDIVDLESDVKDLQIFPERLYDSYKAEWISYIKRQQAKDENLKIRLSNFDFSHWEEFESTKYRRMLELVKRADAISGTDNVTVLQSPLTTYVNQLLKL